MRKFRNWGLGVLCLLVLVFVVQNWEPVGITFLFWRFELPRLVLVSLLLLIGFAAGALFGTRSSHPGRDSRTPRQGDSGGV